MSVGEAGTTTTGAPVPDRQAIMPDMDGTDTSAQGTLNGINNLPTKKHSRRSEGSHPQLITQENDPEGTEASQSCILPDNSLAELRWSDSQFEDIQLLLDPMLFDRVEHNHCMQLPSAVGVPCIDIDPADTFSFLARISSQESASLQSRYDCGALLRKGWEGSRVTDGTAGRQGALPPTDLPCSLTDPSSSGAACESWYHAWLSSAQAPLSSQPAYQIVHQIRNLSQHSRIMHTWSPQLEKDCIRFFSPKNIERFIKVYWTAWHPHYPVIHKATFSISSAPAHLTAAMAVMGACFSQNTNDNHTAKLWLNGVEEMVFTNKYFGDLMLQDPATVNIRDVVKLLQAAYCFLPNAYKHLLTIIYAALCAEAFQINSLISVDTQLQPIRRAIHNWKLAWNQRFTIHDSFGLPKEEDNILVSNEDDWRRLGFFQNASEYWLLLNILIRRIDERQQARHDQSVQSDVELAALAIDRPYTPSRCDSPPMADLKHLISEHHRQFKPYA
ncbi:hypothetical protein APSETT444_005958 [Aspergillus pseudonomiae]